MVARDHDGAPAVVRSISRCARGSDGFRRSPPPPCWRYGRPRRWREIGSVAVLAWTAGASILIALLVQTDQVWLARWALALLGAAAFVPVPPRLRNLRGAFAMIGIPWMTFVLVCSAPAIGRFIIYDFGHDYWMYQRFAYRIVMQGYWLEGGSIVFYFQPFYRWIVGLIHVVFGDSSAGEWYWDGTCLLAGALLSFRITRRFAGFRWGLIAAAATLAVFVLGTAQYLIGQGLSEISSAGLLSMAALSVIDSRHRRMAAAIAAGLLATIAFYTRLNNLIMAAGVALFALPLDVPVRALIHPAVWWRRVAWRTVVIVACIIGLGLLALAWRNWHYSGVFDTFYGTQRYVVAIWQPGAPVAESLRRLIHSVMLVLTVNDPPRFDPVRAADSRRRRGRGAEHRRHPEAARPAGGGGAVLLRLDRGRLRRRRLDLHRPLFDPRDADHMCADGLLERPDVDLATPARRR